MTQQFKMLMILGGTYLALLIFGSIPGTFINYGYDYFQYLGVGISCLIVLILLVTYWFFATRKMSFLPFITNKWFLPIALALGVTLFWFLRTEVHLFGAGGSVAALPKGNLSIWDFIPRGRRLENYGWGPLFHWLNELNLFSHTEVLPSILTSQIYSVFWGGIFVFLVCLLFRQTLCVAGVLLTLPAVFNFFGNVDSYPASICHETLFLALVLWVSRGTISFVKLFEVGALWALGMWIHPFHVFDGFLVIWLGVKWLATKWKKCPPCGWFFMAYAVILLIALYRFEHVNFLFSENDLRPCVFSLPTFSHWLNQMALPLLPLVLIAFLKTREKVLCILPAVFSVFFVLLGFTQGAADQFCYAHLVFIFAMPLLVCLANGDYGKKDVLMVIFINLFLLIPMVAVHSSDLTIQRAQRLYPLDTCRHNRVMSWQTHLTLVLGDNLQSSPAIRQALLATAYHGARHAEPAGFRGGNYCYYVAWHYHFGLFNQGQQLLANLLRQSPDAVRMFLGERPGFIYRNRERLWQDVEAFFPARSEQERKSLHSIIEKSREQARQNPYEKVK